MVDNLTVKPLVRMMVQGGLDAETVNKYIRYAKQVVKSSLAPNGEPPWEGLIGLLVTLQQRRLGNKLCLRAAPASNNLGAVLAETAASRRFVFPHVGYTSNCLLFLWEPRASRTIHLLRVLSGA